jgi:tripartite-type tricarboxylate transporter receptor subunit TctC
MLFYGGTRCAQLTLRRVSGLPDPAPQIEGKKLRAIALTVLKRSSRFPDIPTFAEAGGPQLDAAIWYALWAPAGTPTEVVALIRKNVKESLNHPSVRKAWEVQGADIPNIPNEQLVSFVEQQTSLWTKTVTDIGIKVD